MAAAVTRYLRERLGAPGVNIVTNSGAQAGQVVFHFHVHVIPRWRDCPPPIFSDEGVDVSRVARRHRLTEEEAREVLSGLRGLPEFIRGTWASQRASQRPRPSSCTCSAASRPAAATPTLYQKLEIDQGNGGGAQA